MVLVINSLFPSSFDLLSKKHDLDHDNLYYSYQDQFLYLFDYLISFSMFYQNYALFFIYIAEGYFLFIDSSWAMLYEAGPGFLFVIFIPFGEFPIVAIGERFF